jgi:hypothetical protein
VQDPRPVQDCPTSQGVARAGPARRHVGVRDARGVIGFVIVAAAASRERLDAQRPRTGKRRWNALSDTTANGFWRAIVVFNNFAAMGTMDFSRLEDRCRYDDALVSMDRQRKSCPQRGACGFRSIERR